VVVASIDDRDADWRSGKPVHSLEPAEPGADHDHMMSAHRSTRPTVNNDHSRKVNV
jgi:hypothetical protein